VAVRRSAAMCLLSDKNATLGGRVALTAALDPQRTSTKTLRRVALIYPILCEARTCIGLPPLSRVESPESIECGTICQLLR
jgi:hypothetical protein